MRHEHIEPGMIVNLTADAENRYGLTGGFEVSHKAAKQGYKTPWIFVKSRRIGSAELLVFRPSDLCKP